MKPNILEQVILLGSFTCSWKGLKIVQIGERITCPFHHITCNYVQTLLSMKIISLFIYQTTKFLITIKPAIFCLFLSYLFFQKRHPKVEKATSGTPMRQYVVFLTSIMIRVLESVKAFKPHKRSRKTRDMFCF